MSNREAELPMWALVGVVALALLDLLRRRRRSNVRLRPKHPSHKIVCSCDCVRRNEKVTSYPSCKCEAA